MCIRDRPLGATGTTSATGTTAFGRDPGGGTTAFGRDWNHGRGGNHGPLGGIPASCTGHWECEEWLLGSC
eukprot:4717958-Prymnesium_polylepis.1